MPSTHSPKRADFHTILVSIIAAISLTALVGSFLAVTQNTSAHAISPSPRPHTAKPSTQEDVPRFGHVFLIIGENTTYEHLNSTNVPYLMGTIRPNAAWLTQYYAATHWSQANYVALISGQFTQCEQKDYGALCHQNVDNLFHQLDQAHLTWKTWLEGGAAKCDGGGSSCMSEAACPLSGFYTTGNPAILFDDIEGPDGVWSSNSVSQECLDNDIPAGDLQNPMGYFNDALAQGQVADFNFIIPNGCDDGEANCEPVHNRFTLFDNFLAREVPLIQQSPAFSPDDVIIITYDEDERAGGLAAKNGFGQGGHVVCAILSGLAVPGDSDALAYHYSLLRTIEDGFALPNHVGNANNVSPITAIWH